MPHWSCGPLRGLLTGRALLAIRAVQGSFAHTLLCTGPVVGLRVRWIFSARTVLSDNLLADVYCSAFVRKYNSSVPTTMPLRQCLQVRK